MAAWNFKCDGPCGSSIRKILDPDKVAAFVGTPCPKPDCGGKYQRNPTGPTNQVYERLDNGLMPRAVERPKEAERLFKERADKDRINGKDSP